ncbi:MAG: hypothetical protein PHW19_05595 [Salinivirgaceae bacterium]|nr:hypothetical protein [Salinivirgaceae bacterium]
MSMVDKIKAQWEKLSQQEKIFVGVILILIVGILVRLPYIIKGVKHGIEIFFGE